MIAIDIPFFYNKMAKSASLKGPIFPFPESFFTSHILPTSPSRLSTLTCITSTPLIDENIPPQKFGFQKSMGPRPSTWTNMSVDMLIRYDQFAFFGWFYLILARLFHTLPDASHPRSSKFDLTSITSASWSIHRYILIMVAFQVEYIFDKVCSNDLSLAQRRLSSKIRISFGDILWLSTPWSLWPQQNGWSQGWSAVICKGGMQDMFIGISTNLCQHSESHSKWIRCSQASCTSCTGNVAILTYFGSIWKLSCRTLQSRLWACSKSSE